MKYRIVSRNSSSWDGSYGDYPYYYAQMNVFGIWIDCRFHPFKSVYNSHDPYLETVDKWINQQLSDKKPVKEEVVKTYD
jgi:hypothetical protein